MDNRVRWIIGPPGTGKTTTLARQVKSLVARGRLPLVCSLTNTAAEEIGSRDLNLPHHQVGTLHSHCFRALGRGASVAEANIEKWNRFAPHLAMSDGGRKPVSKDGDVTSPTEPVIQTDADALAAEYHLLRMRMVEKKLWPSGVHIFDEKWTQWKYQFGMIDFTDMIERCYRENVAPPGCPHILIVDEAQDLSRLELMLLWDWSQQTDDGMILCGDPYQALYVWRGAEPNVFLHDSIDTEDRAVLSQSFRVPREVHSASLKWIRQLSVYQPLSYQARPEDGRIVRNCSPIADASGTIAIVQRERQAGRTVMIAATCGYMLARVIAEMRAEGIPFSNPWRPTHGQWNPLGGSGIGLGRRLGALASCDPTKEWWTVRNLNDGIAKIRSAGLLARGCKTNLKAAVEDNEFTADLPATEEQVKGAFLPHTLHELRQLLVKWHAGERTPLIEWWTDKLTGKGGGKHTDFISRIAANGGEAALMQPPNVFVGTVHSFKGAEADAVILSPDLSPAGMENWMDARHRDSVIRTIYVGMTRARSTLYQCLPSTGLNVQW